MVIKVIIYIVKHLIETNDIRIVLRSKGIHFANIFLNVFSKYYLSRSHLHTFTNLF